MVDLRRIDLHEADALPVGEVGGIAVGDVVDAGELPASRLGRAISLLAGRSALDRFAVGADDLLRFREPPCRRARRERRFTDGADGWVAKPQQPWRCARGVAHGASIGRGRASINPCGWR